MARIKEEDDASTDSEFTFSTEFDFEDYTNQMDERKNSYARNYIPTMDIDKDSSLIMQGREKSSTLYSKRKDQECSLDDFNV